jgi:hypothetical protein
MALNINKQTGDDVSASEFNQIINEINNNGSAIGNKVDKVTGNSLVADAEIARLAAVTNQDITGKANTSDVYSKSQSDAKYLGSGTTIPSIAGLASEIWVNSRGFLTGSTFSGSYNDLTDKPSIPSLAGYATEAWVNTRGFLTGSTFSGSYLDLTDKPNIPSIAGLATEVFVNDSLDFLQDQIDEISSGGADLTNYYDKAESNRRFLGTGSTIDYNSLSNKPTIPSISGLASESWVTGKNYLTGVTYADISNKPNLNIYLSAVTWSDVTSKPTFSTVATSGSYNDLSNKPAIPVITGLTSKVYVDAEIDTIEAALAGKVNVDGSKGLTDVNFSVVDYARLVGIEANATKNQTDSYLLNLGNATGSLNPALVTQDANHRFWTDAKETEFGAVLYNLIETKLDISGSTSFISNSSDSFGNKIINIVSLSIAEYEALSTKDPHTLYLQYD